VSPAGITITLYITPAEPYPTFESFTRAVFPVYEKIGANAVADFGTLVYTLQYLLTLRKPKSGGDEQFQLPFLIYPCVNGRVVGAGDTDFTEVMHNQNMFDLNFNLFANKHGSGISSGRFVH